VIATTCQHDVIKAKRADFQSVVDCLKEALYKALIIIN
jgi:hypothetical protein